MKKSTYILIILLLLSACNNTNISLKDNATADTLGIIEEKKSLTQATVYTTYGESSLHTGLSKYFDFQSTIKRIILEEAVDSCIVNVFVINKKTKKTIYKINITSNFLVGDSSFINNNVRSYTTGENKNSEVLDNDFGDIVIADFNFDKKEDIAIKREEGGNGGPLYNYYIQKEYRKFKLDKFLSDSVIWFPTYINKNNKTVTTLVHASAVSLRETTYKLDTLTNKWKKTKHRIIKFTNK